MRIFLLTALSASVSIWTSTTPKHTRRYAMNKTVAAFTALNEQFLAHHEGGDTIAVYPLSDAAFALTCEQNVPPPAGMKLYSQPHKVLLEMAQCDCAERMDAIYRAAREAIGWDRQEWYCRV